MKELKFRAWGKYINEYLSQDGVEPYHYTFKDIADGCIYDADKFVIEQYTGLHDKNGKEIYDGDIADDGYHICKIRWSEHFTAFEAVNENDNYVSNIWFVAKYGEVIGNIHENPELLEG